MTTDPYTTPSPREAGCRASMGALEPDLDACCQCHRPEDPSCPCEGDWSGAGHCTRCCPHLDGPPPGAGPWAVLIDPCRFEGGLATLDGSDDEECAGSGETVAEAFGNAEELFRDAGDPRSVTAETPGVRVVRITRASYDALADDPTAYEVAS